MAGNRIICRCNNVEYSDIRKAMVAGARTLMEVKEMTGACMICGSCEDEIEKILQSVCGCANTSLEAVINAINKGADTVEKVAEITGAGLECGRCKALIQNVIEQGR